MGLQGRNVSLHMIVSTGLPSHKNSASIVICYVIVLLMDGIIVKINDSFSAGDSLKDPHPLTTD